MVNGAMLQAQPELAAPIPVPIVAPPGSKAGRVDSSTMATAPSYGTLRIIQPGPNAAPQTRASPAMIKEAAAIETPSTRLSVTDMLNAIAQESGANPIVRTSEGVVPPIRRPEIEIDSASIMLPRRGSKRVVIRGIIAAAAILAAAIVWFLVTR
jgi:hypothetical protein